MFFVGLSRFSAKMTKIPNNGKGKKFWSKIFFVGIDSECFKMYFEMEISKSKIFSCVKCFSPDFRFSAKMAKIVKKMTKSKILVESFLVGLHSDCFYSYFKPKISKSIIFSFTKFFLDFVIFGLNSKEWSSKILSRIVLVGNDSECKETYFKTKISKSKNFSV